MKYWVVEKDNKLGIVGYSSKPNHLTKQGFTVHCLAPENEEAAWLDIVDATDPETNEVIGKKAVVNQTTKDQVLADREAAENANIKLEWKQKAQHLLEKSDFSQYPDVQEVLSQTEKDNWKQYRADLRDIRVNAETLAEEPIWPEKPANPTWT